MGQAMVESQASPSGKAPPTSTAPFFLGQDLLDSELLHGLCRS